MTNKPNTETFEATLTLKQEGMDGDVQAFLTFNPLDGELGPGGQPEAYNRMAYLMQMYLYMTGMIDERGDLIDGIDDNIDVEIEALPARSIN
jgi:hypothetical protein